jgi:hypothetical protein
LKVLREVTVNRVLKDPRDYTALTRGYMVLRGWSVKKEWWVFQEYRENPVLRDPPV